MILTYSIAFAGFVLISLAMPKHAMSILPDRKKKYSGNHTEHLCLLITGAGLLILSCFIATQMELYSIALVKYTGVLMLCVINLALLFAYKPNWILPFTLGLLVGGLTISDLGRLI